MDIDFSKLTPLATYRTMIQSIIPRPVAWVLTENENKSYNLAPFSFFNAISSSPAIIAISIGKRRDGALKDTRENLIKRKYATVHIGSSTMAKEMTQTSLAIPQGKSEIELAKLNTKEMLNSPLPRLEIAKIAMACELMEQIEIGPRKQGLLLLEIKQLFIDDSIISSKEDHENEGILVNAKQLDPIGRLGGDDYCDINEVITIERPSYSP